MFYVFSYLPVATITEPNAYKLEMHLTAGIIHQVDVLFQSGCNHETFVQIWKGNQQLWPTNQGEKIRGDATVISFREFHEIKLGGNILIAKIWTSLTSAWKEVIIQIGILPKDFMQPLSFEAIMKAITG